MTYLALALALAAFFALHPQGDPMVAVGFALVGLVLALPKRWREWVLDRVLGKKSDD